MELKEIILKQLNQDKFTSLKELETRVLDIHTKEGGVVELDKLDDIIDFFYSQEIDFDKLEESITGKIPDASKIIMFMKKQMEYNMKYEKRCQEHLYLYLFAFDKEDRNNLEQLMNQNQEGQTGNRGRVLVNTINQILSSEDEESSKFIFKKAYSKEEDVNEKRNLFNEIQNLSKEIKLIDKRVKVNYIDITTGDIKEEEDIV
jgi:hypothetical protein